MTEQQQLCARIDQIFRGKLNVEVPSYDSDLIDSAILDSLMFVDLLLQLEQEFGKHISLDNFEITDFRSITKIAEFLTSRNK